MNENPKKGFKYWFVNVFKFHYGKLSLFLLVALIAAVFMTVDAIKNRVSYDFSMVIALNGGVPYSTIGGLEQIVKDEAGDINGDGEVNININILNLGADGENSQYTLMLLMSQDENTLFIMDDQYSMLYASREDFNDLRNYGIQPDPECPARVYIGDTEVMQNINPYIEFYACLADWTTDGKGKPEWTDAAVRMINRILETKT